MKQIRPITIGIISGKSITFTLFGFNTPDATYTAEYADGHICFNGSIHDELSFAPLNSDSRFTLHDVTIGIQFHWQRHEDQTFRGSLRIIVNGESLTAINVIDVEDYLTSVISSEMNANASLQFLKSHAVISRSWAYARMFNYSHHTLYDVCADDHCQRYQGIGRITNTNAKRAVRETIGEVLTYDGKICDARYSKCCGGKTELFSTCWEDEDKPYLVCKDDPYCDTNDREILSQVLNSYDLETADFYKWNVHYSNEELDALLHKNINIPIGSHPKLTPVAYGCSGRIKRLRITTDQSEHIVEKELAIRRALSDSHLKSSAFTIEQTPDGITLHGRGWGHGVGLCQIGAAVMGSKGFSYKEILQFYYPNTEIININTIIQS